MSSILKALKKLEEEQAGRPAAVSRHRSGGQFLAPHGARRWRPWLLVAGGVGCGLLLAGAAYLLSSQPDPLPVPAPAPNAAVSSGPAPPVAKTTPAASPPLEPVKGAPPQAAVVPPPVVATSPAKAGPVAAAPAAARPPAVAASPAPVRPVAAVPATPPPLATTAPQSATGKAETLPAPEAVKELQVEHREIPAPGQQWIAPHLEVSDILPASGGGRMAIVNGLPVMEGTIVENAVVREIGAGQVVFDIDGKSIVVPVAKRP